MTCASCEPVATSATPDQSPCSMMHRCTSRRGTRSLAAHTAKAPSASRGSHERPQPAEVARHCAVMHPSSMSHHSSATPWLSSFCTLARSAVGGTSNAAMPNRSMPSPQTLGRDGRGVDRSRARMHHRTPTSLRDTGSSKADGSSGYDLGGSLRAGRLRSQVGAERPQLQRPRCQPWMRDTNASPPPHKPGSSNWSRSNWSSRKSTGARPGAPEAPSWRVCSVQMTLPRGVYRVPQRWA